MFYCSQSLMCFLYWIDLQWTRSPGKQGSHFNPYSDLFAPNERNDIITSTVCWTLMLAFLVCMSVIVGPVQVLKIYGVPYWVSSILFVITTVPSNSLFPNFVLAFYLQIFVMWLDMVTYLHHHGYDEHKLPWYRGKVLMIHELIIVTWCHITYLLKLKNFIPR